MFKTIKKDLAAAIKWIREYLFHKRHSIRLSLAIKLADMKQKGWNKQYFVIFSQTDKLISLNNDEIERMKRLPRYTREQRKKIESILNDNIEKREAELRAAGKTHEEIRNEIYDLKIIRERTIKRIRQMRLLPKNLDGIKLRKTAFYYTPLSKNNDPGMTAEERKEARLRYMTYAKKYMKRF